MRSIHLAKPALVTLALLSACSHRSSSGPQIPPPVHGLSILVDTEAGSNVTMTAFVLAAALETVHGNLTANLLPEPRDLVLVDPLGRPSILDLENVPAGAYAALHVMVAPVGMRVRMEDGRELFVDFGGQDLVIRFAEGQGLKGQTYEIWQGTHSAQLALVIDSEGVPNWTPGVAMHTDRILSVRQTTAVVTAIFAESQIIHAMLQPFGGSLAVSLVLDDTSVLVDKDLGSLLTEDGFFELLSVGQELTVEGLLTPEAELRLTLGILSSGAVPEGNSVFGKVLAVDNSNQFFDVQVLGVVSGTAISTNGTLPILTVEARTATIYESGSLFQSSPFSAIAVDTIVGLTWDGPVNDDFVRVDEIEIKFTESDPIVPVVKIWIKKLKGLVGEVRLEDGIVVVVPYKKLYIKVGGVEVPFAEVEIRSHTMVYAKHPERLISLADLQVGQQIEVSGVASDPQKIEAFSVKVKH